MAINALAIDIVIPALLLIGDVYSVAEQNDRQWLITAYLLPFGIGQLLFGTLSDAFGRKNVMLAGLALYGCASMASPFAPDFTALLVFRAFAGLGAAAARVAVIATVRDCFAGREMAALMSIVMMVFMAIPIFAPAIGQLILIFAQWPYIFVFMGAFAGVMFLWISLRLHETLSGDNRKPLSLKNTIDAFRIVLSTRRSMGYSMAQALFFGCLFGFVNSAPQVYLGIYDMGALFPVVFSVGGMAVAIANLINASFVRRVGMRRISHSALCLFILAGCGMIGLAITFDNLLPLPIFVAGTGLMFMALGFIGTNFNAIAMEPLGEHAGTAASAFGFIQTAFSALIGAAIGQAFDGTTTPLLAAFVICAVCSLCFVFWAERGKLFTERDEASLAPYKERN